MLYRLGNILKVEIGWVLKSISKNCESQSQEPGSICASCIIFMSSYRSDGQGGCPTVITRGKRPRSGGTFVLCISHTANISHKSTTAKRVTYTLCGTTNLLLKGLSTLHEHLHDTCGLIPCPSCEQRAPLLLAVLPADSQCVSAPHWVCSHPANTTLFLM